MPFLTYFIIHPRATVCAHMRRVFFIFLLLPSLLSPRFLLFWDSRHRRFSPSLALLPFSSLLRHIFALASRASASPARFGLNAGVLRSVRESSGSRFVLYVYCVAYYQTFFHRKIFLFLHISFFCCTFAPAKVL